MGVRKGKNNFKIFQQNKVREAEIQIAVCLKRIKKGMIFETLGSLVLYVAGEIKLNRTTIKRNSKYIELISDFFYKQPGITKFIKDTDTTVEIEQGRNFALQTKLRNRENEIIVLKRKNNQLAKIIENLSQPQASTFDDFQKSLPANNEGEPSGALQPPDIAFADTAQALFDLMSAIDEKQLGIILDHKNKQIVDKTEVGDKSIIAAANRCRWFFDWLDLKAKIKSNAAAVSFED